MVPLKSDTLGPGTFEVGCFPGSSKVEDGASGKGCLLHDLLLVLWGTDPGLLGLVSEDQATAKGRRTQLGARSLSVLILARMSVLGHIT